MNETPVCPSCSSPVQPDRTLEYDQKVNLRCANCGAIFEYLPGFGFFSLQEGYAPDESIVRPSTEKRWAKEYSGEQEDQREGQGACTKIAGCLCCLCISIPSLGMAIYSILVFFRILF